MDSASVLPFQNHKEPNKDFLILDIDHFNEQRGEDFDVSEILSRFESLQDIIYKVFCNAVGSEILKDWK